MSKYSRSHLADSSLLDALAAHLAGERASLAEVLADLAEVDERRLYLAEAYPSISAWCVGKLHLSEQAANKRINAARAARRFPAIFEAVAEGRLHLSAVALLASKLTEENVGELLAAATHKTRAEIELLIAQRFPRRDLPTRIQAPQLSPGKVASVVEASTPLSSEEPPAPRPRVTPLALERFGLQVTIDQATHDLLRRAQELLGHQIPSGNVADVLKTVLQLAVPELEKRKFGATDRPRAGKGRLSNVRYIPLDVKREVWARDQGQCTFVSESGQRCPARSKLEFDHVREVACGGVATAGNLRLLCRAHNQYCAELKFGPEFMKQKRESARRAAAERAERAATKRAENGPPEPAVIEDSDVIIPWLRALGFRADEARRAAEACAHMTDASLEERVKVALSSRARSRPRAA